MKTAREVALLTLSACETGQTWAGAYVSAATEAERLSPRDGALALRLVYGVLQNRMRIDFYLRHFCSMPLGKLEEKTLNCLRLGAYQLLYLDKIPPSAAVNEAVKLTRRYARNPRAPGLVNGVLRSMERSRSALPPLPRTPVSEALALQYSHPQWFVEELLSRLGGAQAQAVLAENNREAPMTLQVNLQKTEEAVLLEALKAKNSTAAPHPKLRDCIQLQGAGNVTRLPLWAEGGFWVQDPAARMAVLAGDPRPGDRVLDACSAPGGKSFAAAVQMKDRGEIISCDLNERKLALVAEGAARLGFESIKTQVGDAGEFRPQWKEGFDLVIGDLPCSGFGVIRKKPDIRYRPKDTLAHLPALQLRLLGCLAQYVRPGGVLLYSTCTVLERENEGVVQAFLKGHPAFSPEPFSIPLGDGEKGMATIWPHMGGTDGFFIAKLRREA